MKTESEAARDIEFDVDGLRIAALGWGREGAPPVLAIHGWLDNAASFTRLAPRLPERRLVAVDLPGHGKSAHLPPGVSYALTEYVRVVFALLDEFSGPLDLVGHSLGAGIAAYCAALRPDKVRSLVLIEGLGPHSAPIGKTPDNLRESILQMQRASRSPRRRYAGLEAMIRARHQVGDLSRESAARLVERNSRRCEGGFAWRTDRRLLVRSPQYFTEGQVLAFLAAIRQPTLLVAAAGGLLVESENFEQRRGRVPDLETVFLDGGHHLHMERESSAAVAAAVERFLRGGSSGNS